MRDSDWARLPTEAIHPSSLELDTKRPRDVLALVAREDRRVLEAVSKEESRIEKASVRMADALSSGGRVFYVGAGTSGRLGVLEAAECPPTYGTDPRRIVAVMAGGDEAVFFSKEGAEDREADGRKRLRSKRLAGRDLVIGISASGVTPFVRGALFFARERAATSVLVTCGPRVRGVADLVIAPRVGPEVLSGSTRMKAGTATKLVLNRMTLLAMIRLGKVFGPYMVDVAPASAKLRDRSLRIVQALAFVERERAAALLEKAGGDVKTAVAMGRLGISRAEARRRLRVEAGNLRAVLEG